MYNKARKTYATKLINSGVDESLVIKQMGHTSIDCTKNYY
ncbi:MAG: site-specific integrase [Lachnospiraceae bacterium]|nr:site-specific integrase [Lachnospiraceae bacterium]MCI9151670.1 site-specific integrase [Lachnospiraceae bacterium]